MHCFYFTCRILSELDSADMALATSRPGYIRQSSLFSRKRGYKYISTVHKAVESHISKARSLCSMSDADESAREDPDTPPQKKFELSKLS